MNTDHRRWMQTCLSSNGISRSIRFALIGVGLACFCGPLQAQSTRCSPGCVTSSADTVKVSPQGEDAITVEIAGRPFTTLHLARNEAKPYLWPVIGPTGDAMTRAYPMADVAGEPKDHIHQRSIWTAWGDIRTSDLTKAGSNYWAEAKNLKEQDRQIVRRVVQTLSGPQYGLIEVEIDWVAHHGRREFTELRTYTFWNEQGAPTATRSSTPGCAAGGAKLRIIDVRNRFSFSDMDVTFADTKEAGILALRVAASLQENGPGRGRITNAAGAEGMKGCWGLLSAWCDYSGPVGDQTAGIAVFDAPTNPAHPPRWHVRDYGLFAVNPFGVRDFPGGKDKDASKTFRQGESAEFRYRIVLHQGDAKTAQVANLYEQYVQWLRSSASKELNSSN